MEGKVLIALLELLRDCGVPSYMGETDMVEKVKSWMEDNLAEVTRSQSVIKTNFTSRESEAMKYYLAGQLVDELMEDVVDIEVQPTKITTKVIAFKRRK